MSCQHHPMISALHNRLCASGQTLSCAESCTGGLIAAQITAMAGVSAWFLGGWVCYSNAMKQRQLGVPTEHLQRHGAVSEAVVRDMAQGAQHNSGSTLALATSGIAGPDGGTPDKPVGLVWFAWAVGENCYSSCQRFYGNRSLIREQACRYALTGLLKKM